MGYNKNTDYMKLMEDAYNRGEYALAAKYEQQRNEKIRGEGLNYDTTDWYSKYLEPEGTAEEDPFLPKYDTDSAESKPTFDYSSVGSRPAFDSGSFGTKPTYQSKYDDRIDAVLNEILSREKFSYDAETDPIFQQYKATYNREGKRAMNDTLAAVASGAGGMNSYALVAAQQANDYYNAQLGDRIPELYNLAYSMYMNDLGAQRDDLTMLQNAENLDYSKYLDSLSQYNTDRNFAYGQYRDQVGDSQWDTEFNYRKAQDALDLALAQEKFDYQGELDETDLMGDDDEDNTPTDDSGYQRVIGPNVVTVGKKKTDEFEPYTSKYQLSSAAQKQLSSLASMSNSMSNRVADSNGMYPVEKSILVLLEEGTITEQDAEYLLRYFGYDATKHFDY